MKDIMKGLREKVGVLLAPKKEVTNRETLINLVILEAEVKALITKLKLSVQTEMKESDTHFDFGLGKKIYTKKGFMGKVVCNQLLLDQKQMNDEIFQKIATVSQKAITEEFGEIVGATILEKVLMDSKYTKASLSVAKITKEEIKAEEKKVLKE